ncbi:hypothetical protein MBLNU230_g2062t1 [Neophaeotheca triangularis]
MIETMSGYFDAASVERAKEMRRKSTTTSAADTTGIELRSPPQSPRLSDMPRSASYTYLPAAKVSAYAASPGMVTIKGSFSEADLIAPSDSGTDASAPDSSECTTPDELEHEPKVPADTARELIAELQKSPKIVVQRLAKPSEDEAIAPTSEQSTSSDSSRPAVTSPPERTRTRGPSYSSFSRRFSGKNAPSSPSTPSRSPSPPPPQQETTIRPYQVGTDSCPAPPAVGASRSRSVAKRRDSGKPSTDFERPATHHVAPAQDEQRPARPPPRRASTLRRVTKPVSGLLKSSGINEGRSPIPALPSLPKSFSTDRLPTYRTQTTADERPAPMPRLLSSERNGTGGIGPARKRDELWNVFRGLDGDYTKFSSKSLPFKSNVVRSGLLPFLRNYAQHPSNTALRPEDLDRRAVILNRWWTGLIEMLHGRNNQSISGTDRPAILDAISGIMDRPEWRQAPSPFSPIHTRGSTTPGNRSTTSLSSNASEFLTESVHHNVKNLFVQNLSAQMAFVVDKMSMRNAAASLVSFCGKACAYAFMFVPGMADILVRLWDLQPESLRRILHEDGIGKFDKLQEVSDGIVSNFPPPLHGLGFTSLAKLMRTLRTRPQLPLGTNNIEWWGQWLDRWAGRESDLFYVFAKHYHILVTDFLPENTTKKERMCAPGMPLVHAQLLTNLDSVIHREAKPLLEAPSASSTFDDILADPDAMASAMPLPPMNAVRLMSENRTIMLIRDFLADRASEYPAARLLFAESFNDIMQAAARGTGAYDHAACYTLIDFLEEALPILVRFEQFNEGRGTLINSEFWQTVCRRIIDAENTVTEVRLYTFLYTIWNTVVCDLGRKSDLCLGLLLDPEVFDSRFNHWCPMVRAYYMRLLCWRVGRFDGEEQSGDRHIYETTLERLQLSWSYYLWLRREADNTEGVPPPTNPCNPAPGRRLLIIKTDKTLVPQASFFSFDGAITSPSSPTTTRPPKKRDPMLSPEPQAEPEPDNERGIRGFIRSFIGSGARSKSRSRSQGPAEARAQAESEAVPHMPTSRPSLTRSATADGSIPRERASAATQPAKPQQSQHRPSSFKFSLDTYPVSKVPPPPMRLLPPRLPLAAQQFLQANSDMEGADAASFMRAVEPKGASRTHARYCGRALAEWNVVVGECQAFFDRRKNEGAPDNKAVETPTLGVEAFRRPG